MAKELSSLQQRLLTALTLVPLVFAAVLMLPTLGVALILGFVIMLTAWELAGLGGLTGGMARNTYAALAVLVMVVIYWLWPIEPLQWLSYGVALWWLAITLGLVVLRPVVTTVAPGVQIPTLVGGGVLLLVAWFTLTQLHQMKPWLMMFLLLLIWIADSAAYFAGRAFGRHKLAPGVSPGKTWEGVYGALAGAVACGVALQMLLLPGLSLISAILLCVATILISIGGDLFESLLKRRVNIKDSGQLLPGHGGMYDRIDSLVAAGPFFVSGLMLLGASA